MTCDVDVAVLVDRLRRDRRQDPYRGRREYSQTARAVAAACDRLISTGHATQAVRLLRKAVDRMTRAMTYVDDSSGIIGDDLQEIMGRYARACAAAPPKPAALATWLVTLACDGPGWPRILLRDFADALGERGLAEVARLVEARAQTADPQSWAALVAVRDLREQLAEVSGDIDRYVTVLADHLNNAVQYERITGALRDAGRRTDAITWARRGLADKAGWPHTDRLRNTLVDMLLADGRPDEAVQVRRDEFARHPTAAAYRALAAIDVDDPTPWVLHTLTERTARQPAYAGELLDALLSLGRHDDAWQLGREHRSSLGEQQWLTLLEHRRASHPVDVLTPYQDMIEQHVLDSGDKHRYRKAVALLPALRDAYTRSGDPAAFTTYLDELRTRHARRPTFLRTLDAAEPVDGLSDQVAGPHP